MKDGIEKDILNDLCGQDNSTAVKDLKKLSLLEEGIKKIKLTPFLMDFCNHSIDPVLKNKFYATISGYYTKFIECIY